MKKYSRKYKEDPSNYFEGFDGDDSLFESVGVPSVDDDSKSGISSGDVQGSQGSQGGQGDDVFFDFIMNPDVLYDSIFKTVDNHSIDVEYRPYSKVTPQSKYYSKIIFLPNFKDLKLPFVKKYKYFLKDRVDGSLVCVVDSLRHKSVGSECILFDLRNVLYNSKVVSDKLLLNNIQVKKSYYFLVQVLEDPQQRELEGRYMVYSVGQKVYDKIVEYLKDRDIEKNGEKNVGEGSVDELIITTKNWGKFFDIFGSPIFNLKIGMVGGYNNYDNSVFYGTSPMLVEGKPISRDVDVKGILSRINDTVPDLSKYQFVEWDEFVVSKVVDYVESVYSFMSDDAKRLFRLRFERSRNKYPYDLGRLVQLSE